MKKMLNSSDFLDIFCIFPKTEHVSEMDDNGKVLKQRNTVSLTAIKENTQPLFSVCGTLWLIYVLCQERSVAACRCACHLFCQCLENRYEKLSKVK